MKHTRPQYKDVSLTVMLLPTTYQYTYHSPFVELFLRSVLNWVSSKYNSAHSCITKYDCGNVKMHEM